MEKLKVFLGVRLGENIGVIKSVLLQIAFFVMSFLFGGISFAGGLSPFATGFIAAVTGKYLLSSAVGAAAGYAVFFGLSGSLRFIAAVCLIALIRLGFYDRIPLRRHMIFSVILTFLSTFVSSLAVFVAVGGDSTFTVMCLCESAIAAAFSSFTVKVSGIAALKKKGAFFAPTDTAAAVFFGCILLLSLDRFTLFGFSIARCVAYFVIMLFALCGKEAASCIAGVCSALTLGISETHPHLMLCFILTGLMTGLTGIYGKLPVSLSLVFSTVLSLILAGDSSTALISMAEVVVSGALFFITPQNLLFSAVKSVTPLSRDAFDEEKGRSLHFELKRRSKAVRDISHSVNAVSNLLQKNMKPSSEELYISVKDDICKECTKYDFCWNKCKALTEKAFVATNSLLAKKGRLITEELPDRLSLICRLPDKITESFNSAICRYDALIVSRNEIFEAKRAAVMQFSCLAGLLDDASEKILSVPRSDPVLASTLTPLFREKGFVLLGINAFTTEREKSILQVYCSKVPVIPDISLLLEEIYEITGISYQKPVTDEYSEEGTVLSFFEESRFYVEYHTSSHTGAGESFSGDTSECFYDGTGRFYAVLSDGMGTGTSAAIDSVMTCSLMSRLMRAGFGIERAFDTVNCALLVKSADETLSTLDIFSLDLETAGATFYKAGAAASIIYKDGRTLAVEKSSLPLGILKDTKFEKSNISLSAGDTVIIMSDGASVIPNLTFKDLLNKHSDSNVKALSKIIVDKALELSPSGKHDDITVTCIRIRS